MKHLVTFLYLKIKSKLLGFPMRWMAKDYFIFNDRVIKIDGLGYVTAFRYDSSVQHIYGDIFYINKSSVIDVSQGMSVLYNDAHVIKNVAGVLIDDIQHDNDLNVLIEEPIESIMGNFISTVRKTKAKKYYYTVYNLHGDVIHQFEPSTSKMSVEQQGDRYVFTVGKQSRKLHRLGIPSSQLIPEA